MSESKKPVFVVGPKDGESLAVLGDTHRIVVSGSQTNGEYAVIEIIVPPGGGPGPHSHPDFHETFYVIEGEVELQSEQGSRTAKQGDLVVIPKGGVIHHFKNASGKTAKLWFTVVPAGLDALFQEVGTPVEPGQLVPRPTMTDEMKQKLETAAKNHRQELFPPDYFDKQS